nr:hypothetical protein [Streptomyces sp. SLBN-115]
MSIFRFSVKSVSAKASMQSGAPVVELRPIGGDAGADRVEGLERQALGVVLGLEYQWWEHLAVRSRSHSRPDRRESHGTDADAAPAADGSHVDVCGAEQKWTGSLPHAPPDA